MNGSHETLVSTPSPLIWSIAASRFFAPTQHQGQAKSLYTVTVSCRPLRATPADMAGNARSSV
jgi:hypothetical protein